MWFDFSYLLFIAPGLLLALVAAGLTKSTFAKYSRVPSARGLTGQVAATEMLRREGVYGVTIERVGGHLTDHYDPTSKRLRLSRDVYDGHSLAAIGVACHEAGHAIQHDRGFAALKLRSLLVPATSICASMYMVVIVIGFIMHIKALAFIGLAMCAMAVIFALVTLPVEWDASRRAKIAMVNHGLVTPQEAVGAGRVLNAAFLTYLGSAITSLLVLLYWLYRLGLLGSRND